MRDKWDNVSWKRFWANTSIWSKHSQNTRFLAFSGERHWSRTWLATPGDSVAQLWQRNPSPLLLCFVLNEESIGMDLWDSVTDRLLWQQNSYKRSWQEVRRSGCSPGDWRLGSISELRSGTAFPLQKEPHFSSQLITRQPSECSPGHLLD